ncbi:saccharopine dehydrogenase-like oxidoreductase [Plakobranchus ocellatus]|uniref:Saccharopine dehydrogenase-like oxidoreductase n=1 Tax=Plakobranchus ocellatus TaxID=259542 RepID=A0AAV4AX15_9GAST|nr:saccharopine dehydrogenase-like oxidoreductase [Plakobranchus ocellatus]
MASKKFDLVVFGASGFTGQYVVDEVSRVAAVEKLTWAIAGRSMAKLQKILREASSRTGKNLEKIPIIIADTTNQPSLDDMAKQARVVLNCVGPYRFYGEPVVRACIEHGAHHLDISGEPQYLETMQLLYDKKAKENNVLVIGAAGFDSIPAEAGVMYLQDKFENGRLTGIESYLSIQHGPQGGGINFATYESAVHGISHAKELIGLRKSLYPEAMPKLQHRLVRRPNRFYSEDVNKWCLHFMGSDKSVVYRTIRNHLTTGVMKHPIEFFPYLCLASLFSALKFVTFWSMFTFLSQYSFGRWILLKFPQVFTLGYVTKAGPTQEQTDTTTFSMTYVGYGFDSNEAASAGGKPNRRVLARLSAPDLGYVTTSICLVQSGVIVLKEAGSMRHSSGVLTPGAAFFGTSLLQRLEKHNIKIVTLSDTVGAKL